MSTSSWGCKDHHPNEPKEYVAWRYWSEEMSKTHKQVKCSECKLYKIWIPKQDNS